MPQFSSDGRWLGVAWHGEQAQLLEVTPTREYRTLVSSLGAGQGGYHQDSDISPDGRLLALDMDDAVRLWDLPSGRELAVLPPGRPLFQSNGELLIAGPGGLHRWPIQPGAAANELRLGPPRTIALPAAAASVRPAVRTAARWPSSARRAEPGCSWTSPRIPCGHRASTTRRPASSPSAGTAGGWRAAAGTRTASGSGMPRPARWSTNGSSAVRRMVFFTPDSRALIICRGDEFSFWDVETLQPIRRLRRDVAHYPGHVAFSPDGGLMALEMAPAVIHLKDVATGRTVAKLEDPHGDRAGWMSFTPDGTQLVVTAPYAKAVHVWDLRAIRQRLKEMGLDWDWPEFPPADPGGVTNPGGSPRRGPCPILAKRQQDIARFRQVFEKRPDDPNACNTLAWV